MRETRRSYPQEFKTEAVELLLNSEKKPKDIAEDPEIDANMIFGFTRACVPR